ncbi:hypothetical protein E2C01_044810 [Portunus trituberculatus]|uniref:Uncharacterized protein n=1 Tax=Portunus trituberculatus TaxID=210409 RepID=A0A5B7G069_PORTR|nr:hypothetical protein [Portunus trituberculatus]
MERSAERKKKNSVGEAATRQSLTGRPVSAPACRAMPCCAARHPTPPKHKHTNNKDRRLRLLEQ